MMSVRVEHLSDKALLEVARAIQEELERRGLAGAVDTLTGVPTPPEPT